MGDQSFFTNLPSEITFDILSRLPIKTVGSCKCVNKPWLHLLQTPEFVNTHLSKSHPGLLIRQIPIKLRFFDLIDEVEIDRHELHYNPIATFDIIKLIDPTYFGDIYLEASINGVLLLRYSYSNHHSTLYLCNPITRDCIVLPRVLTNVEIGIIGYGFGISKRSGRYKVVRVFQGFSDKGFECQIYSIGTGAWRTIEYDASYRYFHSSNNTVLNGNLHWLVSAQNGKLLICCFDLETEEFSFFLPPSDLPWGRYLVSITALENRLCVCDNMSNTEIVIWIMEDYGLDKCWTKECVISIIPDIFSIVFDSVAVYPLKVFKDGDILMRKGKHDLFYYSNKTKSKAIFDSVDWSDNINDATLHVPSLVSLKTFVKEKFISL